MWFCPVRPCWGWPVSCVHLSCCQTGTGSPHSGPDCTKNSHRLGPVFYRTILHYAFIPLKETVHPKMKIHHLLIPSMMESRVRFFSPKTVLELHSKTVTPYSSSAVIQVSGTHKIPNRFEKTNTFFILKSSLQPLNVLVGRAAWRQFLVVFIHFKASSVASKSFFSCLAECWNAVLLGSSRNVFWAQKLHQTFHQHGVE